MARGAAWTDAELVTLHVTYPDQGLVAAMKLLPGRSDGAIHQKAHELGLKTSERNWRTGTFREFADEAWRLRHEQGLSYASIGVVLGCCEANATNAVLYANCVKAGRRPIERTDGGRLLPEGRERLRLMLRKGWTHRRIQEWTGAPASMVSRERRDYEVELRAKRLAPLPPLGSCGRYSGAKIPKAVKREVERLYLDGYGTKNITVKTGVSNTHCLRTRTKLINRLKRKGECLPGCDIAGKRRVFKDHIRHIPAVSINQLEALLLAGEPVRSASHAAGVGTCTGYKVFQRLKAELEAKGEPMPRRNWRHGSKRDRARVEAPLPGDGQWGFTRYRQLLRDGLIPADARAQVFAEHRERQADALERDRIEDARRREEGRRPKSFEEQLALVTAGARIGPTFRPPVFAPEFTLGGIASGALG